MFTAPGSRLGESEAAYTKRMERHVATYHAALRALIPGDTLVAPEEYRAARTLARRRLWTQYLEQGADLATVNAVVYNPNINSATLLEEVRTYYRQLMLHARAFIVPLAEQHPAATHLLSTLYIKGLMALPKERRAGQQLIERLDGAHVTAIINLIERSDATALIPGINDTQVDAAAIKAATMLFDYLKAFPEQTCVVFYAMIAAMRAEAQVYVYLQYKSRQ